MWVPAKVRIRGRRLVRTLSLGERENGRPSSLHSGCSLLDRGISKLVRVVAVLCARVVGLFAVTVTVTVSGAAATGYGPAISVPRDLPAAAERKLPSRNRVDQTREEAHLKSR